MTASDCAHEPMLEIVCPTKYSRKFRLPKAANRPGSVAGSSTTGGPDLCCGFLFSDRANIDISMLSRLESGKRRLALDHIPGLAAALSVSTDELLGGAPAADPRVRGEPITRDGLTMWPLTNRASGGLRTFKIRITSKRRRPPPRDELRVHDGHDWMYVLDGRMRLILGQQDLVVEPGEAVEFSTLTPHWFGAIDGPVELIAVFGADGERTHLHD